MAAAGANDAGEVVGLAHDYALLEKKDGDGSKKQCGQCLRFYSANATRS